MRPAEWFCGRIMDRRNALFCQKIFFNFQCIVQLKKFEPQRISIIINLYAYFGITEPGFLGKFLRALHHRPIHFFDQWGIYEI